MVSNPWYLGGNVSAGSPGGLQIARSLYAKAWISAHDAEKNNSGLGVKKVRVGKFAADKIKTMLQHDGKGGGRGTAETEVLALASGESHKIRGG
jgi:hypothetical protein